MRVSHNDDLQHTLTNQNYIGTCSFIGQSLTTGEVTLQMCTQILLKEALINTTCLVPLLFATESIVQANQLELQ